MELDQRTHAATQSYMHRWFTSKFHLADMCGLAMQDMDDLILAGCAPGVIYSFHEQHGWWSALSAATGKAPQSPPVGGDNWYSPGARWWLRRAMLAQRTGMTHQQAACHNKQYFCSDFSIQLYQIPYAHYLFGDRLGSIHGLSKEAIAQKAGEEWHDWISGAFAVCLIHFSAETCIRKGALSHWIKSMAENIHQEDATAIFNLVEELAPLMMPFTPWERPAGTPGLTIDAPLMQLGLGAEYPFTV